ncbi:kinase-like protein, partial [Ceratobasidium sp. AG-I]
GSGRVFAVKKSRAPLCFNRSRLQHEGRVLQLLQGHPYILPVLAYGRFQHFEFLSIELLGAALDDLYTDLLPAPIQTMFVVADQMLSALEFVHSHQIVHRDVKLGNIMVSLDDPPRLKLIDFGMSRHFQTGVPKRIDLYTEVKHLAGTINYASLNSHDGIELSRRDDLESLFYSVFSLLRGSLPWKHVVSQFYYTTLGEMRHVHEFKKVWSGAMLAEGHPEELGRILDLVRRLTFDEDPDYLGYRCILESLRERLGLGYEEKLKWPINLKDNPPGKPFN